MNLSYIKPNKSERLQRKMCLIGLMTLDKLFTENLNTVSHILRTTKHKYTP